MGKEDAELLKGAINKGDALYLFFENTTQFLTEVYGADSQKVLKYLNDNEWFSASIKTLDKDDFKDKSVRRYLIFGFSSYYYYMYSKNSNLNNIYNPKIKWWETTDFDNLFYNLNWYEPKKKEDQFIIRKNESLYSKLGVEFNILPDKVKDKAIFNKSYVFDDILFKPCFEDTGDIYKNLFISACLLFYRPTYDKEYKFTDILNLYFNKNIKSKLIIENINYYFQTIYNYNSFQYLEFMVGIDFKFFISNTFSFGDTSKKLYIHLDDNNILYYVNDKNLLKLEINDKFLFLKDEFSKNLEGLKNSLETLEVENDLITQNNFNYEEKIQSLKKEKSTLEEQIKEKGREIDDLEKYYEQVNNNFNKAYDYHKNEVKLKDKKIENLNTKLDEEKFEVTSLDFKNIQLQNENTKLDNIKSKIEENLLKLKNDKYLIEAQLKKLQEEREELLKKEGLKKKTIDENTKFRRENLELKNQNNKLYSEYTKLVKNKAEQDEKIRNIEIKLIGNDYVIKKLNTRLKNTNIDYDELYISSEECKSKLNECVEEKNRLEEIINLQAERIRKSEKDVKELRQKLKDIKEIKSDYQNYTERTEKNLKNLRSQFRIKKEETGMLKNSQNNLRSTLTLANEKIRRLEWLNEKAIDAQQNYIKKTLKNPEDTKLILDTVKNVSEKTGIPKSTMLANIKLSTTSFVKRNKTKLVLGAFGLVMLSKMTGGDKNLVNNNIDNNITFQNFTNIEAPTILDYNNTFDPDKSALVLSDFKFDEDVNKSVVNFPLSLNKLPATTEEKVIDITLKLDGSIDIPNNYDLYMNRKVLENNLELDRELSVLNKSDQTEYLVNYFIKNDIFFVTQEFFNETKDNLGLVQINDSTDLSKLNESQLRYLVNTAINFLESQRTKISVGAIYSVTLSLSYYLLASAGIGSKNVKLPRMSAKNYRVL